MKKFWIGLLIVLATIAVALVIACFLYLRHPLFGELPQGERLARIEASPNYVNGAFQNLMDTPFLTEGATQLSIQIDNFRAEKGTPRPEQEIPTAKTDLHALDPNEDIAVWLGHSSWYVQVGGKRLLIDPVFSDYAAPVPGLIAAFAGTNLYSADDMPPIDVLLITHDHYDHVDYPTIMALKPLVNQVVAGLGTGAHFESWGYDPARIHELDWHDTHEVDDLLIHATPARHYSGRTFTRNQSLWVGFVLETPLQRLFFSGDSGYGDHFTDIGQRYGPFEWVTLDSGQYDPRWAYLHMNPEQAAQAASDLGTDALTPAHVGRFTLAPHDWHDPFERLTDASEDQRYELWTPMIGQAVYFDGRAQAFESWWQTESEGQ
ncbi:MBL fold metallo-hydrolase [Pseudomonas sp. G11-1]|uniref:MBL fold metallo-hydrolase n=1 Tax=Halopseudomonas bauzanensis TaxID=653930 RepID=A0A4U0YKT0_9GAMM|nr:MBL fold metallo-hydrolase [Halopseudomonas bauzanensis]EZQ17110.1 beta-lactamase [Halopseudomonas bauzanensis]MCO5785996.1 MBL fold metallo-hydrolase [Pseudomonas sp. G11-1]MCO5789222.1 MBL fold metallo-hydrolase [Pseudomonas sp. G11-2]TKA90314.1 MBL fold metallo-hydrolase [Halopseudomonas bauzanensis]